MKKLRSFILYTSLLTLLSVVTYAQGPGFDDDVTDTPIDGGVCAMAIAGVAYGAKKLKDIKKKNNAADEHASDK